MPAIFALQQSDLMSLEQYAKDRPDFRARAMAARKARRLHLGEHFTLQFENRLTVQYQVQEMLRVERIYEPDAIAAELASYNPLISQGSSLRCTLFIEFPDERQRRQRLQQMGGIEHCFWLAVGGGGDKQMGIANEDMERSEDGKTSAVHFMRFELNEKDLQAMRNGAEVSAGVSYRVAEECIDGQSVPTQICKSWVVDLLTNAEQTA